jgi:hypothetical protein
MKAVSINLFLMSGSFFMSAVTRGFLVTMLRLLATYMTSAYSCFNSNDIAGAIITEPTKL